MDHSSTAPRPFQAHASQPAHAGAQAPPTAAVPPATASALHPDQALDDVFCAPISPAEFKDLALSPPQKMAIEVMLSGNTMVAAANAAGITRKTLYNWLHHDAKFQAAYNAWQQDALTSARSRLLAVADEAVDTVERAVKTDSRVALTVLKSLGILDRPTPGSTDPDEIQEEMDIEERRDTAARGEAMFFASIGSGDVERDGHPRSADLIAEMEKIRAVKALAAARAAQAAAQ